MKHVSILAATVMLFSTNVYSREHLYESFDEYPNAAITNQVGWTLAPSGGALLNWSAGVTNIIPFTGRKSLHLAYPFSQFVAVRSAAYTNFTYNYLLTNNPIIRASMWIYGSNTNMPLTVELEYNNDNRLRVSNVDGHIELNSFDTGVSFVTGRYANLTLYYDISTDRGSLDYDGTNIVHGVPMSTGGSVIFNTLSVRRSNSGGESDIYIDNVVVETFPRDTFLWWRCEEVDPGALDHYGSVVSFPDRLGRLKRRKAGVTPYELRPPQSRLIYTGDADVHNAYGLGSAPAFATNGLLFPSTFSNWTVEAIHRMNPEVTSPSHTFFAIGRGNGFDTTNSQISFRWAPTTQLQTDLRDNDQTTTSSRYLNELGTIPDDGKWHHLALQKSGSNLITYVDYRPTSTNALDSRSSGSYTFDAETAASAGISLNGAGLTSSNDILDEVRFSGAALPTSKFLQYGEPIIIGTTSDIEAPNWIFDVVTIPGKFYYMDIGTMLDGVQVWTQKTSFVAGSHLTDIGMSAEIGKTRFIRARRRAE
ncbi:MAG: LamG domain-containing protein [Verrucomicrobia bacterium]|nr:LamG domain-containing protein [Verrucomicrobiota bacterium]